MLKFAHPGFRESMAGDQLVRPRDVPNASLTCKLHTELHEHFVRQTVCVGALSSSMKARQLAALRLLTNFVFGISVLAELDPADTFGLKNVDVDSELSSESLRV
jgi:hypothetical protein